MNYQVPDCFYRIGVKGLIIDEKKKFLLIKEDNGWWDMPGGGIEFYETAQQALEREIKEEMGLTVTSMAKHPSYFLTTTNPQGMPIANIIYTIEVKDLHFTPSRECIAINFFTAQEVLKEKDIFPNVREFAKLYEIKE